MNIHCARRAESNCWLWTNTPIKTDAQAYKIASILFEMLVNLDFDTGISQALCSHYSDPGPKIV